MAELDAGIQGILVCQMDFALHGPRVQRALSVIDQQAQHGAGEGLGAGPDGMVGIRLGTFPDQVTVADDYQLLGAVGAVRFVHEIDRRLQLGRIHALRFWLGPLPSIAWEHSPGSAGIGHCPP